ncbi:MAG: ABC transporter ATP-binding protein [Nitrospiraceae bacterium]
MGEIAIRVEGLNKRYRIGVKREPYPTLSAALGGLVTTTVRKIGAPFHPNGAHAKDNDDTIWALKDVSFEIQRGEVLGIIGSNGAGKSTLLKILSRITVPTSGRAELHGRVGSLLEVGTGFDWELTGRENIYLNGAILGMRKAEIDRKFDEIVDFSGVEKFIDTPVKRYSSGMYVRLAFAVAAHLEPEILIVDEVLAVGDAAFQKKCLGKMGEVVRCGRTILFVTHNLGAITQICPSSIVLEDGRIAAQGPSKDMVAWYLARSSVSTIEDVEFERSSEGNGDGRLRLVEAYLEDASGCRTKTPVAGEPVSIVLEFDSREDLSFVQFCLTIFNQQGIAVTHCNVDADGKRFHVPKGRGRAICHIPRLPLPKNRYKIAVAVQDGRGAIDCVTTACVFDVETSNFYSTAFTPPVEYSAALVEHSWTLAEEVVQKEGLLQRVARHVQ